VNQDPHPDNGGSTPQIKNGWTKSAKGWPFFSHFSAKFGGVPSQNDIPPVLAPSLSAF